MRHYRIIAGILIWSALIGMMFFWLNRHLLSRAEGSPRIINELWEFASAERRMVQLQFDGLWPVSIGDPIYHIAGPGSIEQVGELRRLIFRGAWSNARSIMSSGAEVLLYPNAPELSSISEITYYTTPQSLTWVMETMLPPHKRVIIANEIARAYGVYHKEILKALEPVILGGLVDAMRVVEKDLAHAISRHLNELEKLGNQYQDQLFEKEVVPLFQRVIWPILQRHAQPLAKQIGQEMYERISLWRFGWRLLYDQTPLPKKELARAEWNRFIHEEGIPILNRHKADIVAVQKEILEEIATNRQVRDAMRQNLAHIVDDPEFRAIVWRIFREVVVENPRLRHAFEERWTGAEAQQAMQLAANYTEPCVRRIGDLLLGTRADGISPEFAQVLRNQILDKDCCWFVIQTHPASTPREPVAKENVLKVRLGKNPEMNPFAVQLQGIRP